MGDYQRLVAGVTRNFAVLKQQAIAKGVTRKDGTEPEGMMFRHQLTDGMRQCGFTPERETGEVIVRNGKAVKLTEFITTVNRLITDGVLHPYIREEKGLIGYFPGRAKGSANLTW